MMLDRLMSGRAGIQEFGNFTDFWRSAVSDVLDSGSVSSPRGQQTQELIFWAAKLTNPRARLLAIRERLLNPFFLIGEWFWILRGSNQVEEIAYYLNVIRNFSDDGATLHGAYGPRLFGVHPQQPVDQVAAVLDKLRRDPDTRQAVLQIYLPQLDWQPSKDIPCLCQIQFFVRAQKLHAIATMRSQDLFRGMPYDIAWMTLLQEYMGARLNLELGDFVHVCGSLHLYETDRDVVETLLHSHSPMGGAGEIATMKREAVSEQKALAIDIEKRLRSGEVVLPGDYEPLTGLWRELVILLSAFRLLKNQDRVGALDVLAGVKGQFGELARVFITDRKSR